MPSPNSLRFSGEVLIDAPVPHVWQILTSPERVSQCVPGLVNWKEISPKKQYALTLTWLSQAQSKIAVPMRLIWERQEPMTMLCLTAVAFPSTSSTIKGSVQFDIQSEKKELVLRFTAVIQTPNPFFKQLLKNILPKQIDQFFRCFKKQTTTLSIKS